MIILSVKNKFKLLLTFILALWAIIIAMSYIVSMLCVEGYLSQNYCGSIGEAIKQMMIVLTT